MNARALFVGADGRAHPPWRLLLFLALGVACVVVVMIALNPVLSALERLTGLDGTATMLRSRSSIQSCFGLAPRIWST